MKTPNAELMRMARESLKGKWGIAIGALITYMVVLVAIQIVPIAGILATLIITGPMIVGMAIFVLSISRNQDTRFELIFEGFNNFANALGTFLLALLFIILWSLLLVIPGIIAAHSYALTFFIVADDKNIKANDAINLSKKMMDGYKWKLFCLMCRFIGWGLLCLLTAGIGFLWLIPYMYVSFAKFYDDVRTSYVADRV